MKRKKIIVWLCGLFFVITLVGIVLYFNDSFRFKLSYESINFVEYSNGKTIEVSIPYDNRIEYLNEKEVLKFLEDGTGILYFGYNTCPWCRNMVPVLIDSVVENDYDIIYYADSHKLDISSIKDELFSKLDSYLSVDEEGNKGLAVPDVYFVKDGIILGHHLGTVDSYTNPYVEMTDSEKQELKDIFGEFIKELK